MPLGFDACHKQGLFVAQELTKIVKLMCYGILVKQIMKQTILLSLACLLGTPTVSAQPRYDMQHICREKLNRGVVAIKSNGKVTVSWRLLKADQADTPFDVYRNGEKLNSKPIADGGTFFIDEQPLPSDATYEVRGGSANGSFLLTANAPEGYLPIKIDKPAEMTMPDGKSCTYSANDCSVADVDGDGEYEIILKWEPSNAADNSHTRYTGNVFFDCLKLYGTRLWRIDMGRNIRAGAHYTQFIAYDLDGDGRAELMMKTADGTIDGKGKAIGDPTKDWRCHQQGKCLGRIMDGPEYLTVFNGLTGESMKTVDYIPDRGPLGSWGDSYGNRSERYLAGVGYLDGHRASAIFCRGYYTRTVIAAWDWDGKELTSRWVFDTNNPEWKSYAGQGNHNLRIADVDGDGKDEITFGSMAVDHDGRGLYNTGFGHGDALHLMPFYPDSDKLQVWDCHENRRDGSDFRDAATGKVIFQLPGNFDVGRCMAADIDPTNPGVEMWSANSGGIRNVKGELVKPAEYEEPTMDRKKRRGISTNFGIWWDGDLLRELLDHESVQKYDWKTGRVDIIKRFDGRFNNWTKSNPCLSGDIIGDWREEVLIRDEASTLLRLYVTDIPTPHRIPCLMEDIPYRLSVATENVAYNQPPEPGFYLGTK